MQNNQVMIKNFKREMICNMGAPFRLMNMVDSLSRWNLNQDQESNELHPQRYGAKGTSNIKSLKWGCTPCVRKEKYMAATERKSIWDELRDTGQDLVMQGFAI